MPTQTETRSGIAHRGNGNPHTTYTPPQQPIPITSINILAVKTHNPCTAFLQTSLLHVTNFHPLLPPNSPPLEPFPPPSSPSPSPSSFTSYQSSWLPAPPPGRGGEGVVVGGDIGHDGTLGKEGREEMKGGWEREGKVETRHI